ncbi:LacI family transcriptional regulator [Leucothrix arctica]|uniref:LacI family transcriptional regulator n=2 Tax=Leucothrix arctica TaxID=1481894 RepID=A0A317CD42_9GAMM|nr:LacI family transcriptional regulator [Leucothrix arctica]
MSDVAKLAGVSPMTVSRALRPNASASESTRKKIREAADQLGYVLDSTAAGLSSRKTGFVAVTIPSINNANFANTIRGLNEGLQDSGLQVLLGFTDYNIKEEERLVEAFLRRRPEAIVVTGGVHTERCRRYLAASGVPVIEIWDLPSSPIEHSVGFSNVKAGRAMANYLVDKGYKNIGFIGGNTKQDARGSDRCEGFAEVLEERGLSTERLRISEEPVRNMAQGAAAMDYLIDKHPDTQAVMCASDLSAFGAMMSCQRRGLKVPEDIAIAGFGGYDISANAIPQITTLEAGDYQIGTETAKVILSQLADDNDETEERAPQRIKIATQLLERESTSPK